MANDPAALTMGRFARARGGALAAPQGSSVLVLGPPGSGADGGIILPNLSGWQGPALVAGATPELIRASLEQRRRLGPVAIFDPALAVLDAGTERVTWDAVAGCREIDYAESVAEWLITGVLGAGQVRTEQSDVLDSARSLLAPMLYAAAWTEKGMSSVCDWIDTADTDDVRDALADLDSQGDDMVNDRRALAMLDTQRARSDAERAQLFSVLHRVSLAFRAPGLRQRDLPPLDLDTVLAHRGTVYLCLPDHAAERVEPLLVALVNAILAKVWERGAAVANRHDDLLLALVDVVRSCPIKDLAAVAERGFRRGVYTVASACDMGELAGRYGADVTPRLVGSFGGLVILPGCTEESTRRHISGLLAGKSKGAGWFRKPQTNSWLLVYQQLGAGQALAVRRSVLPTVVSV